MPQTLYQFTRNGVFSTPLGTVEMEAHNNYVQLKWLATQIPPVILSVLQANDLPLSVSNESLDEHELTEDLINKDKLETLFIFSNCIEKYLEKGITIADLANVETIRLAYLFKHKSESEIASEFVDLYDLLAIKKPKLIARDSFYYHEQEDLIKPEKHASRSCSIM